MSRTTTHIGAGALRHAGDFVDCLDAQRVCCVVDAAAYAVSGAEAGLEPMLAGRMAGTFCDFSPNPKLPDVVRCADWLRCSRADAVIAVGGGSAMDVAKTARLLAVCDQDPEAVVTGRIKIRAPGLPLLAVPTTAGTGSEATHFAVVYVHGAKYSLAADAVRPEWAVVDPELTQAMPPRLTAVTGFDALSQAVESLWAPQATPDSRKHAGDAVRRILRSLPCAVHEPTPAARLDMAVAAHFAGKAIDRTKTTAPHAVSYTLTSEFGIPHGHAAALTVAPFVRATAARIPQIADPGRRESAAQALRELAVLFNVPGPEELADAWTALMAEAGLETGLHELGIAGDRDLHRIVQGVNAERLGNHPVPVTTEMLRWVVGSAAGRNVGPPPVN